jgi:hypothetical protein
LLESVAGRRPGPVGGVGARSMYQVELAQVLDVELRRLS